MNIEILYPEICSLFGDRGNYLLLQENIKNAQFIFTSVNDEPFFVNHEVKLIYMGPTDEKSQIMIINRLSKYKNRIKELIDNGTFFFFTGNAYEILGKSIIDRNGKNIQCLNIFDYEVKRDMLNRKNSLFMGEYDKLNIVGFESQFDFYNCNLNGLFKVKKGFGRDVNDSYEGIKVNNFYATTILGPILILNPSFAKEFLNLLGCKCTKLMYEDEMQQAYNLRVEDFERVLK